MNATTGSRKNGNNGHKENAGDQVFAANVDEVLAGRIIDHTKASAGDGAQTAEAGPERHDIREDPACSCCEGAGKCVACLVVLALMVAAVVILRRRFAGTHQRRRGIATPRIRPFASLLRTSKMP